MILVSLAGVSFLFMERDFIGDTWFGVVGTVRV